MKKSICPLKLQLFFFIIILGNKFNPLKLKNRIQTDSKKETDRKEGELRTVAVCHLKMTAFALTCLHNAGRRRSLMETL